MAKNKNSTTNETTPNPISVEQPIVAEVAATDKAPEQSLVKVAPSDLAVTQKEEWLLAIPKTIRSQLEITEPIEEGELSAMIAQLPEEQHSAFEDFMARMNPVKAGVIVAESRFRIPNGRIFHGVGDDAGRPPQTRIGSLYTSDGRILAVWDKNDSMDLKVPQTFTAAVVGIQETRTWWKPRDKNYVLPPDVDPNLNAPICRSLDRKRGSRYGSCPACPHRPYANGKYDSNSCHDEIQLYVVLRDFSGIYQLALKGMSLKNAIQPIRRAGPGMVDIWDKWFEFGLSEEKNSSGRWFSLTAAILVTPEARKGVETTQIERSVFSVISRQIMNEVYRRDLKAIYTQVPSNPVINDTVADMEALRKNAEAPVSDYSKNNL